MGMDSPRGGGMKVHLPLTLRESLSHLLPGTLPAESSECLLPSQNQGGGRMPDVWLMASEDVGDNLRDKRDKTPKRSADTQSRPKSAF